MARGDDFPIWVLTKHPWGKVPGTQLGVVGDGELLANNVETIRAIHLDAVPLAGAANPLDRNKADPALLGDASARLARKNHGDRHCRLETDAPVGLAALNARATQRRFNFLDIGPKTEAGE